MQNELIKKACRLSNIESENYFLITSDLEFQNSKPSKEVMGLISNNTYKQLYLNLNEFSEHVGSNGLTFCPSIFTGSRSNANFLQTQLLALDFDDNSISVDGALQRLEEYNITPNVVYHTLSSTTNHPKFRARRVQDGGCRSSTCGPRYDPARCSRGFHVQRKKNSCDSDSRRPRLRG